MPPPLTLVQKRALAAASNNVHKAEKEFKRISNAFDATLNPTGGFTNASEAAERNMMTAYSRWTNKRSLLNRLEKKTGVNSLYLAMRGVKRNAIANVLKKHKLVAPLIARTQEKVWSRGLNAEKKRALENFALISSPSAFRASPRRKTPSPKRKTPSPPRRRTPSPARPVNNAHRRIHGIGPANNTRVTWSRNANGKISIHKTLTNLDLSLSNAQKNALNQMSETNAIQTIRELARRP